MIKKLLFLLLLFALSAETGLQAQSFSYVYKGITFKCKANQGVACIKGFDEKADKVVIPSQVSDKRGRTYPVKEVDLFVGGSCSYKTTAIAIEAGITHIEKYCFYGFRDLREIYIPQTVEYIGKKAFNARCLPTFNMPGSIDEQSLCKGLAVYPKAQIAPQEDAFASLDMSAYSNGGEREDTFMSETSTPETREAVPGTSDIDYNLPVAKRQRDNTFCLIIANENYHEKDTPKVKYAAQDGKTFRSYCEKTLGMPRENIKFLPNAKYLDMKGALKWFSDVAGVYKHEANFIIYYAGHGIPDERGNCKLLPSDVSINNPELAFGLKDLYSDLGKLTTSSVLVFVDACFSGNDRENVAAIDESKRGIVKEVKDEKVSGNVVVLTAASGTETALSYDEKAHGMFSYFLCKKLQETGGEVNLGDLYKYVKREVERKSVVSKGKLQTPCISYSSSMSNKWQSLTF